MSGIYIPGMEMPESCSLCQLKTVVGLDREKCLVSGIEFHSWDAGWGTEQRRHDSCPLVPVPEHGRLVDADALPYTRLYKDNWIKGTGREAPAVWKEDVDSAPTIIPADEEAEE